MDWLLGDGVLCVCLLLVFFVVVFGLRKKKVKKLESFKA